MTFFVAMGFGVGERTIVEPLLWLLGVNARMVVVGVGVVGVVVWGRPNSRLGEGKIK